VENLKGSHRGFGRKDAIERGREQSLPPPEGKTAVSRKELAGGRGGGIEGNEPVSCKRKQSPPETRDERRLKGKNYLVRKKK